MIRGVRTAVLSDAAPIAHLAAELGYSASEEEIAARLELLLPQPAQFVAVAEVDGSLVGWIAAEQRLLLESGERIEIVGLVVSERHRRQGYGAELVAAVEAWAQARRVRIVAVRSNVARAESHSFYEGLGYRRTKTQHAYRKQVSAAAREES